MRSTWIVGVAFTLAGCRCDNAPRPGSCPDGSTMVDGGCVAMNVDAARPARRSSAIPPVEVLSNDPDRWTAPAGREGVVLHGCTKDHYVLAIPVSARPDAGGSRLLRALDEGDTRLGKCAGGAVSFMPLLPGLYEVTYGYDDPNKKETTSIVEVRTRPAEVHLLP